jgi:hypothetical protein
VRAASERGNPLDRPQVFAVEDTAVQLTWGRLAPGSLAVTVGDRSVTTTTTGGPGTVVVDGLEPDRTHQAHLEGPGLHPDDRRLTFRTLRPPPGPELLRFATLSDLHLGADSFDLHGRMREAPHPDGPHPTRCARSALDDLAAWGAERLVLKGDLTQKSQPGEWRTLGALLAEVALPVDTLAGNHDEHLVPGSLGATVGAHLAAVALRTGVEHLDLPGIRLVFVDTTVPPSDRGRLPAPRAAEAVARIREAPGPVVVLMHHYLRTSSVPWFLPLGVPPRQAGPFLQAVAAANPATLITSGHSHRHRRRAAGPVVVTEVGSPKDYPGTWAGYVVHEGGIRQVVRRVSSPDCLEWLERTRAAAFGTWGRWSPGHLDDRCFAHLWPARA